MMSIDSRFRQCFAQLSKRAFLLQYMVQNKDPQQDNTDSETLEYPVLNEISSSNPSAWSLGILQKRRQKIIRDRGNEGHQGHKTSRQIKTDT